MQQRNGSQHILDLVTTLIVALLACKIFLQFMNNEQQVMSTQIIVESLIKHVFTCVFAMIGLHLIDHSPMESLNEQFNA